MAFEEHPDDRRKFDLAEIKLPAQYTMDEFWKVAKYYKKYISKPPARYLLNLSMKYPWDIDENANAIYSEWELIKN